MERHRPANRPARGGVRSEPTPTVEDIFTAALALPPFERDIFLRRSCAADPKLEKDVRTLLEASTHSSFVKEKPTTCFSTLEFGNWVGDYRVIQQLGEGGCGVVYLAEQLEPIRREVALKIIKPGMDTRAVIHRFEAERQALALMDHPNIAKVFDAGATISGRPYFAMELVRGIRITEYCKHCRLTIAERIDLIAQVCSALQHAHEKGVIHRDIKPSNVLVTLHGGAPLVKVIDFGVAKAMQGRLTDETLCTLVDQFVGTPAYVSPEQTEQSSSDVDARSDIYSVGVLLYEILTERTPLDPNELAGATLEEVRRRIREEPATAPSRLLQHADPRLAAEVKRDLDWIVLRCLEKEKDRRYRSASELASDLDRYSRREPVLARPPSLVYAFTRFAARNRAVVIAGSIVMSVLCIATAVSTWQAVRATKAERIATQERERAEDISDFLLNVFSAADPFVNFGREPTARDLLEQAGRKIQTDLSQQPEVRARLLEAIGRSYRRMGLPDHAVRYLREAMQLAGGSPDGAAIGSLATELAIALLEQGNIEESESYFAIAMNAIRRSENASVEGRAKLLMDVSRLEAWRGETRRALSYATEALELMRTVKKSQDPDLGDLVADMAVVLLFSDELEEAERMLREAMRIYASLPEHHPSRVIAEYNLGEIMLYQGRAAEAAAIFERSIEIQKKVYGSVTAIVADTMGSLALARLALGNVMEAERAVKAALAAHKDAGSTSYLKIGYLQTILGMVALKSQRFVDAEDVLRDTLMLLQRYAPADHEYIASAEYYLGEALLKQLKLTEAEAILSASMQRWTRSESRPWRSARSANALGEVLYRLGRKSEGARLLVDSYRVLMNEPAADPYAKELARERISRLHADGMQEDGIDDLSWAVALDGSLDGQTSHAGAELQATARN